MYGDSYRSDILVRSPFASSSIVSMRGMLLPFMISDIVEAGSPVIRETCRTDKFRFAISISSIIFIWIIIRSSGISILEIKTIQEDILK